MSSRFVGFVRIQNKPSYQKSLHEWANDNVVLSNEYSDETGRYQWERTPYVKEIFEQFQNPKINEITVKCSAQVSKTMSMLVMMGFVMQETPAPILLVFPTKDLADAFSVERLDPFIRDTGVLGRLVYDEDLEKKKKGTKILRKKFVGGTLNIVGSNSESSLSSRSIKYLFFDELSQCDTRSLDLARKRTATYSSSKIVKFSTPTIEGGCMVSEEYEASDQRKYYVPCPHCKNKQILVFENLIFYEGKKDKKKLVDAYYRCENCKKKIEHKEKYKMLAKGEWRGSKGLIDHAGFWINALYSPFESWNKIRNEWLKVRQSKQKEKLREFNNLYLGETWEEDGFNLDNSEYYQRREDYLGFDIPVDNVVLTCSVDVQGDRLEGEVVAWGDKLESWGVEYFVIRGDPNTAIVWEDLDGYLSKTYNCPSGTHSIGGCLIDSGGHHTQRVYDYTRPRMVRRIFPYKGDNQRNKPIISKVSKLQNGSRLVFVGTDTAKEIIYSNLQLQDHGIGYMHYPTLDCYDENYFKMLTAEKLITKKDTSGYQYMKFVQKHGVRNEALDIRVMNLAMITMINPNFKQKQKTQNEKPKRNKVLSQGVSI